MGETIYLLPVARVASIHTTAPLRSLTSGDLGWHNGKDVNGLQSDTITNISGYIEEMVPAFAAASTTRHGERAPRAP